MHSRSRRHQVSASIGIVLFPEQGRETHQLMANADLAMYQAKEKGRGRWHIFSAADQSRERADARVLWGQHIAEALNQDRFELRFQPIVAVATGRIVHYEALLRMRDAQGGIVYPDRFVPVAEKTGQIQAIDHWVLSHALGIMSTRPGLRMSVNLSANAMEDPLLLPDVEQLLKRFGVEPASLTFEITETAAINSILRATRLMRGIQRLGCRFALDDFGSGYASYAYLRQLPVDDVKVDGAFIRNLARSREDRIFVKAITDIAHGMGKRVVAEFVEDGEILSVLEELGVDFAQGYHFGRPVALSECRDVGEVAAKASRG
jgi:EAL domain-containing protein (putative c-di-GMP-specific phosphodiesterase class I)